MPKLVLLDVDGTLVNSNDAHAHAWVEALGEAGHTVPFERVREEIGKGGDKLLPDVVGLDDESPEGKRISERRRQIFKERYLPRLSAFDGARGLLEELRGRGLDLVVATSAKKDELRGLLEVAGVQDLLDGATSSDDAEDSKPDADIVVAALHKAHRAPEEAVMLGDTPYDVEAARKAGVATVALRSGGWDDEALAGAVAIYDDVRDLLVHLDDSPLVTRHAGNAPRARPSRP